MSKIEGDVVTALKPGSIHRRQDLEPVYLHDGAVVAVSRSSMLRGVATPEDPHAFFGVDRRGIFTEMGETIEIDHQRDLYWAEAILRERQQAVQLRKASMKIRHHYIDVTEPVFVIAEIGVNHDGSVDRAHRTRPPRPPVRGRCGEVAGLPGRAADARLVEVRRVPKQAVDDADPTAMLRRYELSDKDLKRVTWRSSDRALADRHTVLAERRRHLRQAEHGGDQDRLA